MLRKLSCWLLVMKDNMNMLQFTLIDTFHVFIFLFRMCFLLFLFVPFLLALFNGYTCFEVDMIAKQIFFCCWSKNQSEKLQISCTKNGLFLSNSFRSLYGAIDILSTRLLHIDMWFCQCKHNSM